VSKATFSSATGSVSPIPLQSALPVIVVNAAVLLLLLSFGNSSTLIPLMPLMYYCSRRITVEPRLSKWLWLVAGICATGVLSLHLPPTRKALAGHYLAQAQRACVESNNAAWGAALNRAKGWYPNHPILLYAQYRVSLEGGEELRRDDLLLKAVDEGLEDPDGLYEAARVLAKRGEQAKEISLYRRILKLRPAHPEANYCLAMYYDQEGHDRPKAVHHLRIARDNLPEDNVWRARCEELLCEFGQEP